MTPDSSGNTAPKSGPIRTEPPLFSSQLVPPHPIRLDQHRPLKICENLARSDLEQAAVEQVAYWFQNRDKLGLLRRWPHEGIYEQLSVADLLPSVSAVLQKYRRWTV